MDRWLIYQGRRFEMVYVVRKYIGHCKWDGTHPSKFEDKEFGTLQEALTYRKALIGVSEIYKREVLNEVVEQ